MKLYLFIFSFTAFFSTAIGQELILIRHAQVSLEHKGWMNSKKAAEYREAYDTAPVYQFERDTVLAKIPKRITDTIYVSGLPRSIATGVKLYGDSAQLVSLDLLNEFELYILKLPLYMPYKVWTSLSRGFWLLGMKKEDTESYREAKNRVKTIADLIEKKAITNRQIILVTHGFINRNIAKEMKKRGWEIEQNNGKENLGATVLQKIN